MADTESRPHPPERQNTLDALTGVDDPPPPYTPTPNADNNEQSVEYGPSRPFQQQPPQPPPVPPPPPTSSSYASAPLPPPPPRPPVHHHPPPLPPAPQSRPTISSPPSSPNSIYHPPLGHANSTPGTNSTQNQNQTSYQPSQTPIGGQPLLNKGQILVYPPNTDCPKCHKVGYKSNDPSNPCKKCWQKYGRPYSSAMRFALEESNTIPPNYQKPLPQRSAPPPSRPHSTSTYPGQYHNPGNRPPYMQPQPPVFGGMPPMQGAGYYNHHPNYYPGPGPGFGAYPYGGHPPPPQQAGRICYSCNGQGRFPVPFLEPIRCPICYGSGRI